MSPPGAPPETIGNVTSQTRFVQNRLACSCYMKQKNVESAQLLKESNKQQCTVGCNSESERLNESSGSVTETEESTKGKCLTVARCQSVHTE